jgi:hypothetical protein
VSDVFENVECAFDGGCGARIGCHGVSPKWLKLDPSQV